MELKCIIEKLSPEIINKLSQSMQELIENLKKIDSFNLSSLTNNYMRIEFLNDTRVLINFFNKLIEGKVVKSVTV